ncbi:MAG: SDR family NAD(P)-dependent oxidoreductase [Campylobacteraceae bacterium]
MSNISAKWALITGASAGIGKAIAIRLAKDGCNLIITARRKEKLQELKESIKKNYNVKVLVIELDVKSNDSVLKMQRELEREAIVPNFLINNAGLAMGLDPIQSGEIYRWEAMIDTNLKGLLYVTRAILPKMVERGDGHVINIGSTAGWQTYPGGNVYNATKFGVRALSDAMSLDLVNTDVKVSCVAPGSCETDFTLVRFEGDKARSDALYGSYKSLEPEDIADMIAYILNAPKHVNIPYVRIMATSQRNSYVIRKNTK